MGKEHKQNPAIPKNSSFKLHAGSQQPKKTKIFRFESPKLSLISQNAAGSNITCHILMEPNLRQCPTSKYLRFSSCSSFASIYRVDYGANTNKHFELINVTVVLFFSCLLVLNRVKGFVNLRIP